jgi:hypothetical protein
MTCPLCAAPAATVYASLRGVDYHRCAVCELTFMDPSHRPSVAGERARYDTHRNDPGDVRYRAFLDRLAVPLAARLAPGAHGLDYGSGPGPTLSLMLEERGFHMSLYDPYYAPHRAALERRYDFITCTEVVEHFFEPGAEFERLDGLLNSGGWLGVMTGMLHDDVVFDDWHYARDPTHVCFYRPRTMEWIADRYGWTVERPARTVVLFGKP